MNIVQQFKYNNSNDYELIKRNYVRRSSTKKTFRFDPTKNTADTGSLVSDWPIYKKMFSSETTLPVGTKHYMNDA
jgi:hypothetical protein